MATRRAFITGLVSFVAAPAIVRVGSLMPVKVMPTEAQFLDAAHRMANPVLLGMDDMIFDGRHIMLVPGWVMEHLIGQKAAR